MKNTYRFIYCNGIVTVSVDSPLGEFQSITQISLTDFADIARIVADREATDELVLNAIGEAQI